MKRFSKLSMVLLFGAFLGGMSGCTADVEDEGEMPEVNVEGGEMPEVDVDPARVEVGTDTQMVEVPDVDVETVE